MKTQNKHGVIFFLLAFAIVLIAFFSFVPKSSNNSQQEVSNPKKSPENYFDQFNEKPENKKSNFFDQFDETPENKVGYSAQFNQEGQESQNTNIETTSSYSYNKNSNNYHSYDDSNSDKYVYRTRSAEDTSSRTSNDYYQNTDSYSSPRSNYGDYSTSSNSYSAPMTTPAPVPQPTHMTSCDGSGCWDNQGNRYAGNNGTYFQQNGGVCRDIGGMVQCN